jgi:hypothetical protein
MDDQPVGPGAAFFDTSGRRMQHGPAQHVAGVSAAVRAALGLPGEARAPASSAAETAMACFELHSGATVIQIQVEVDLNSRTHQSPFAILQGSLRGDICTDPVVEQWTVVEGYFGDNLFIVAERTPLTNKPPEIRAVHGCAQSIAMIGFSMTPACYPGIFGYDNQNVFSWPRCNILFKGWQACW